MEIYPRDMVGYGQHPPNPEWPGKARIAVQFVINYEEGGETVSSTETLHPKHFFPKSSVPRPLSKSAT